MARVVVDASAVLALIQREAGAAVVAPVIAGAAMSSLNYAETVARMNERGVAIEPATRILAALRLEIVPFDAAAAIATAHIRAKTRHLQLSLADRACLALGLALGVPVYTADRAWRDAGLPVELRLVR